MAKRKIYRAGLIPYYVDNGSIKVLFMRPSNPNFGSFFFFQVVKGKVEEGEDSLTAAIREASEEAGLFPPNLDGTPHKLGNFLGRTTIYVCKIKDPNAFGDPTTPEEVESTKWMTPEEFQSEGRDLHKPVVKAAVRYIKKHEGLDE